MRLRPPKYIENLAPYRPGKPIEEVQREFGLKDVIKLASNENPLGPSPLAMEAVQKHLKESHRYPDATAHRLRKAVSQKERVSEADLLFGCGSDHVMDVLIRSYLSPGDQSVTSHAAFVAFRVNCNVQGVEVLEAPLLESGSFDLDAMLELIRANERVKLTYLANPNNPTGTHRDRKDVRKFLDAVRQVRGGTVLTIMDYAYWEYVTDSEIPEPQEILSDYRGSVVVLRTFSKVYGLGGMRVGYGAGDAALLEPCQRVRQPFSLNHPALVAAEAALHDQAFVDESLKVNAIGLVKWRYYLGESGIPFMPTQGNFLLINTQAGFGKSGNEVFELCLKSGVIFRPVGNYGMPDWLRVSVGTPAENERAIEVLKALRKAHAH